MRVPFLDIKAQHRELAHKIEPAVLEVLRGGRYIMGLHHEALEQEVAGFHECKFGIGVNSGTDALRIIMDAAGIGHGDEVITTAFTFVASAETIVQTGARPVFVDIDPTTFMIDVSQIEAAITPRTKGVMPIHLFGQLADVEGLQSISERTGIPILEDAAQAIGSSHGGKAAGKFGLAAGFSFYVTKNLGADGDAGMILTDDEEMAARCRAIRVHGMMGQRYYYDFVGYTSRLDEVQAAVLRIKLEALVGWNEKRSVFAASYLEGLKGLPLELPVISLGNRHTWHQFTVRTSARDALKTHLGERGIDSMIYYPVPLHFHKPYEQYSSGPGSLPMTEQVCLDVLSLPIHPHMIEDQAAHVIQSVREFFGA